MRAEPFVGYSTPIEDGAATGTIVYDAIQGEMLSFNVGTPGGHVRSCVRVPEYEGIGLVRKEGVR